MRHAGFRKMGEGQRRSTANPLYEVEERKSLILEGPAAFEVASMPRLQMKDQEVVEDELEMLSKRAGFMTAFMIFQAGLTLVVVIFASLLMQQVGIKTDDWNVNNVFTGLYKTGKFGNLVQPSGGLAHAMRTHYDDLALNSGFPDSYLKRLDQIDMSFNAPLNTSAEEGQRRALAGAQDSVQRVSVSAKVKGFIRKQCEVCATGYEVLFHTDQGKLLVRDGVSIPHLDAAKFPGLDVKQLSHEVAGKQVTELLNGDTTILQGALPVGGGGGGGFRRLQDGNSLSIDYNQDFSDHGTDDGHLSATYSHVFTSSSHSSVQGSMDFNADYNTSTGETTAKIGISLKW